MKQSIIKLIVGLGNPGETYKHTRHNIGADFVSHYATQLSAHLKRETKFKGYHAQISLQSDSYHLFLPTTYMNNSGEAVATIAQFYKIPVESILVVHDELDLPTGTLRLKHDGGHGGHNGVRDIINHLHSGAFVRLRIGIGRPDQGEVTDYVLNCPLDHERQLLMQAIAQGTEHMPDLLQGYIDRVMQRLHTSSDVKK